MIEGQEKDHGGEFKPVYEDSVFVDALEELGRATAPEVAKEAGIDYRTTKRRLERLDDLGRVNKKRYGNTYTWTVAQAQAQEDSE